ncbi:hypothetical protein EDB83DRAFT_2327849 [Lactarius deliciosus]|nr:hypothetical protein EDB83DRAFT_2327849 [Lactarius deliciosus]
MVPDFYGNQKQMDNGGVVLSGDMCRAPAYNMRAQRLFSHPGIDLRVVQPQSVWRSSSIQGRPTHGARVRDLTALEEDLLADDEEENTTPDVSNATASPGSANRGGSWSGDDSESILERDRTRSSSEDDAYSEDESVRNTLRKQKETCDRSSSEVEQLLPPIEPSHDPRNFYASDSPVIEDPDLDEEPDKSKVVENIDQDGQGDRVDSESNGGPNSNAPHSHTSRLSSQGESHSQPRDSPTTSPYLRRADQRRGASSVGRSNSSGFEQQAYIVNLLEQIKLVRDELALLLGASPPYGSTPSPSRLSAFASEWENSGHGVNACETTAADFMVDIAGDPKSPWNTGCDDTSEMRKAIEKAFNSRVKSLKSRWKRDMLPQAAKVAERSKHNRKQRKYQLFQRRREIVKLYDPLKKHLEVMDALGADGMSSDESSFDPHTSLHSRQTRHVHAHTHRLSEGLPVNAYDPNWLQSKTPLSLKHELRPKEDPYGFNHSPEVIAYVSS